MAKKKRVLTNEDSTQRNGQNLAQIGTVGLVGKETSYFYKINFTLFLFLFSTKLWRAFLETARVEQI